ncbi:MAG: hypothetical protein HS127_13575 [Planctomycetia bacterium]|nr:hypothetical protein [Planctomycetia bacterium]
MIYSANGEYLGSGNSTCATRALKIQPPHLQNQNIITSTFITQKHKSILQAQAKGIDYHQIISERPGHSWHSSQKLALLMGHKALSAFSSHELESLKKCYNRIPALNESFCSRRHSKMPP